MHANPPRPISETYSNQVLSFTIPERNARGRAVRLDSVLDEILSAHDYPAPVAHVLAEALLLTTLAGGLIKQTGAQVTLQAQTSGPISLLVCDYRAGALRGYVGFDAEAVLKIGGNPSLSALFGEGFLALTFDLPEGNRYQGIVPFQGDSLAEACEHYFAQSEQVPTLIRVAITGNGSGYRAAGLIVQHLAEGEEGRERLHVQLDHPEWEHVAILAGTVKFGELLDPDLSLDAIIWRLFHEEREVRIQQGASLSRGCRCSESHYQGVLAQFPDDDLAEMRDQDGVIVVDCAFCSKEFAIVA